MSETDKIMQQLVDCIRMLERADIIDYNGHASIRAGENRMFINIGSCQRSQLNVDDICTIDFDGTVIEGNGKPPLECHLHAGVYKARADVQAVVHAHPKRSTFLTMVGETYQPVYAQGSLVYPMPVFDSPNSINNPAMAKRLADTLGDQPAAMMKSHGAVTVGKAIMEALRARQLPGRERPPPAHGTANRHTLLVHRRGSGNMRRQAKDREPVQTYLGSFPRETRCRDAVMHFPGSHHFTTYNNVTPQ